jgi:hypothetical protein
MTREEVVRREKELQSHYIQAHDSGDERKKGEVMGELLKNVEQRKFARRR